MEITQETLQQAWRHFLMDCGPDPLYLVCTNVCHWLRENYFPEARIMGYFNDDNPTAIVGQSEGGHDFLILDDQIIDFWHKELYDEYFPLALPLAEAPNYYGDSSAWVELMQQAA
jgi:hypothetical protein